MNPTLLLAFVFVSLAGTYYTTYNALTADALADGKDFSRNDYLKHTALEMAFSLLIFVCLYFKVDISSITELAGDSTASEITTIGGAITVGAGIPKIVNKIIMPIFKLAFGSKTARKVLREKDTSIQSLSK